MWRLGPWFGGKNIPSVSKAVWSLHSGQHRPSTMSFLHLSVVFFTFLFFVSANVRPKLDEVLPRKAQNVGTKFQMFCIPIQGSKPFKFSWNKNGRELVPVSDRVRLVNDDQQSQLIIEHLEKHDSGNYSCSVSNRFGSDSVSTLLTVQGGYIQFCDCIRPQSVAHLSLKS